MSYEIAPLILLSQDRTRMLNFLSDVFEFEIDEQDFLVSHPRLLFRVEEASGQNLSADQNFLTIPQILFNFHLKTEDELNEIVNKFNFFQYRRSESMHQEKMEIIETDKCKTLLIYDIDLRPWRFDFKKALL